jgi:large subunit ribosomal protein L27
MSKTKTQGKTSQHKNRPGKRLGMKIYGGQTIKTGQIIVTQRGTKIHPGSNVGRGRDHSLYALKNGTVDFITRLGKKLAIVK